MLVQQMKARYHSQCNKDKKMTKIVTGECLNCESSYEVAYVEQLVSQELPEHCPFCGEPIEDIQEEYIDEDDDLTDDDLKWE